MAPVQQQNQSSLSSMLPPPPPSQQQQVASSTLIDSQQSSNSQYYHKYNIGTALVSTVSANSLINTNGAALISTTSLNNMTNNNNMPAYQSQRSSTNHHHSQSKPVTVYSPNFWENYEHLCALHNVMPLQSIKSCVAFDGGVNLTLNADKLKSCDWEPLLNTIRGNKNLMQIQIHSNYVNQNENDPSETARLVKGYAKLKKPPSIRNKDRTYKLCRSLKDCMSISHVLNKLEVYNIPLNVKDCSQIAKGLRNNKSIKILSLDRCLIGDEGLSVICKDIQGLSNLNRVNFSSCNLTHEGANILATLIKVQALKRHNEAWKDSLRYGRPDLDSMFGIRRITINSNQQIGDKGVQYLSDAFKSDLWLKALDLQDCGISTQGAKFLLDGLKFNAMMHVLDVRLNINIDRDTLQKIMEQVMINSTGNSTEYEWMDIKQTAASSFNSNSQQKQSPSNSQSNATKSTNSNYPLSSANNINIKIKKRRNTNASFNKGNKNQSNSSGNSSMNKMKRCKSTGSVALTKSPSSSAEKNRRQPQFKQQNSSSNTSGGIPWRTAARANRQRGSSSCAYRNVVANSEINDDEFEDEENHEFMNFIKQQEEEDEEIYLEEKDELGEINNLMLNSLTFDNEKFVSSSFSHNNSKKPPQFSNSRRSHNPSQAWANQSNKNEFISNLNKIKNVSVKDLLVILQKEHESKTQLENMLLKFKDENTKLKAQVSVLRSKLEQNQQQIQQLQSNKFNDTRSNMNRTLLDDDKALEIIERTLYKYQNFLDFLRNAGFGKLIDIGEMNQTSQLNDENTTEFIKASSSSKNNELSDQQKYYLNKINKAKSKIGAGDDANESSKNQTSSRKSSKKKKLYGDSNENEDQNIDTLLSNALEISKSYRRYNSSHINSTGINQNLVNGGKHKLAPVQINETTLNDDEEEEEELANNKFTKGNKILPDLNELEQSTELLLNQYQTMKQKSSQNSNKESAQAKQNHLNVNLNLSPVSNNNSSSIHNDPQRFKTLSNASTSPQTTMIAAAPAQPPKVSTRTITATIPNFNQKNYNDEDEDDEDEFDENDKEIEDDNVSEVISEDSRYYFDDVKNLRPASAAITQNSHPKNSTTIQPPSITSLTEPIDSHQKFTNNRMKLMDNENERNENEKARKDDEDDDEDDEEEEEEEEEEENEDENENKDDDDFEEEDDENF